MKTLALPRDLLAAAWFHRTRKPVPSSISSDPDTLIAWNNFEAGFAAGILATKGLTPESTQVTFVELQAPDVAPQATD